MVTFPLSNGRGWRPLSSQTAKVFNVSKSTAHKDVTARLMEINPELAREVRKVLDVNKQERHIRGGMATKEKYLHACAR